MKPRKKIEKWPGLKKANSMEMCSRCGHHSDQVGLCDKPDLMGFGYICSGCALKFGYCEMTQKLVDPLLAKHIEALTGMEEYGNALRLHKAEEEYNKKKGMSASDAVKGLSFGLESGDDNGDGAGSIPKLDEVIKPEPSHKDF
jgi:hypothetical protein